MVVMDRDSELSKVLRNFLASRLATLAKRIGEFAGDPDDLEKKSSTTLNFIDFCDFKTYLKWMEI